MSKFSYNVTVNHNCQSCEGWSYTSFEQDRSNRSVVWMRPGNQNPYNGEYQLTRQEARQEIRKAKDQAKAWKAVNSQYHVDC